MYNGVGVGTSRGTGTNGYVQKNLSYVQSRRDDIKNWKLSQLESSVSTFHEPDVGLLNHKLKRRVELLLLPLRDKLEAEGFDEDEIEDRLSEDRIRLRSELSMSSMNHDDGPNKDTHELAFEMAVRDSRAAVAFGIDMNKRDSPARSRSRSRSRH